MLVERTKRCTKCANTKLARDFYYDVSASDWLSSCCRQCQKARVARRRRRIASLAVAASVESQKCGRCGVIKPAADFHRSIWELSGLAYTCKACQKGSHAGTRTPEERRCSLCDEVKGIGEFNKCSSGPGGRTKRCKDCEGIARAAYIYGLDYEVAKAMREQPACDICGRALEPKTRCIDHCHETLIVRGVVCSWCNGMLGMAKDDPGCLEAGAAYLRRFAKKACNTGGVTMPIDS